MANQVNDNAASTQPVSCSTEPIPSGGFVQLGAWILFCVACLEMAFLQWFIVVIPGQKTNLFLGLLSITALMVAILAARKQSVSISPLEIWISVVLMILALVSPFFSSTPLSSSGRSFLLVASGIGGFWCGKLLVNSSRRHGQFAWLCSGILLGLTALTFWGMSISLEPTALIDTIFGNPHQLVNAVILLAFGPIAIISARKPLGMVVGSVAVAGGTVVLYICGLVSSITGAVLLLPLLCALSALTVRTLKGILASLVVLAIATGLLAHFLTHFSKEQFTRKDYQAYRIESYGFSWHVVKKHPITGVGLRAPRDKYIDDYEIQHPALSKERFLTMTKELVTPENSFLALLTGLGVPFFALYVVALILLLFRLTRNIVSPPAILPYHPIALFIPLAGGIVNSFTTDTLYHAQICWYFHVLLGMIPVPEKKVSLIGFSLISPVKRLASILLAVVVGIFVGTHPALSPEVLAEKDISSLLKALPFYSTYFEKQPEPTERTTPVGADTVDTVNIPQVASNVPGTLVIQFNDFRPGSEKWNVLFLLDNSESMAKEEPSWTPSRLQISRLLVGEIASSLPTGSKVAVRTFQGGLSLRFQRNEIPLRVSQRVFPWTSTPCKGVAEALETATPPGPTNLCAAAQNALLFDLGENGGRVPRLVLVTDGGSACDPEQILDRAKKAFVMKQDLVSGTPRIDVLGLGLRETSAQGYSQLAQATGGVCINIEHSAEQSSSVTKYVALLKAPKRVSIQVTGDGVVRSTEPGKALELPPGSNSVWLPSFGDGAKGNEAMKKVVIQPSRTTVLTLSTKRGGRSNHLEYR